MKFIKLTDIYSKRPIVLNINQITMVKQEDSYSRIVLMPEIDLREPLSVSESVDEVYKKIQEASKF